MTQPDRRPEPVAAPEEDVVRRLGIKEEFHLVDLTTRRLAPMAGPLLESLGDDRAYVPEMQNCVVETRSEVVSSLEDLGRELTRRRSALIAAADRFGLGVVAAGTVPLSLPAELDLTQTPRYRRMLQDYQLLAREQLICGTQVHVDVPDRDEAAAVAERVAPYLPTLLALSASSPFSAGGTDTGYASSRTLIWSRWPTTGLSSGAATAEAYDDLADRLVRSGVITDPGMIYYDVRLPRSLPTIELRICDSCPSVDTILLIAGLFRALVDREVERLRAGESAPTVLPPLGRAATWRAARSGLEEDLVDLPSGRARPAAEVVQDLVRSLEPWLRRRGDWDEVEHLAATVLLAGSSAARQRLAYRLRGRLQDVVDLLVAETRGVRDADVARSGSLPAAVGPTESLDSDETRSADGRPRPPYRRVMRTLDDLGHRALRMRADGMENAARAMGSTFRVHDGPARVLPLDIVPRLVPSEDWEPLAAGAAQRAKALDLFIRDIYGPRSIEHDGIIPSYVLDRVPAYRSVGRLGGRSVRAHVCGLDIVQDRPGHWICLEDNLRIPSGAVYALNNRELLTRFVPELTSGVGIAPVDTYPATLLETLRAAAPARSPDEPGVVVLTSGPEDSAYSEHRHLATAMGVPLVQPADLHVTGSGARIVRGDASRPVHVAYARIDSDMLLSSPGADGVPLREGLIDALHRGHLSIANALGNGVGDDKAVYAYVPEMIRYYLGEDPLLDTVPTYLCADRAQRDHVLDNLERLVTKPIDGYGGLGVVVGPDAGDEALAVRRAELQERPEAFIAQDVVPLTTHPTFDGEGFHPRCVDLRVFVHLRPGDGARSVSEPAVAVVPPVALTRVAPAGSRIVNSSAGGGTKDTWIVARQEGD